MKLNAKRRNALPETAFALPGRRYPIDTPARGRAALSRAAANATPAEDATIKRKVQRRYPSMNVRTSALGKS